MEQVEVALWTRERFSHMEEECQEEFNVGGFQFVVHAEHVYYIYLKHTADKRHEKRHNIPNTFIIILRMEKGIPWSKSYDFSFAYLFIFI